MGCRSTRTVLNKPHKDKFTEHVVAAIQGKLRADLHFTWTWCIDRIHEADSLFKIQTSCHWMETENITPDLYKVHISAGVPSTTTPVHSPIIGKQDWDTSAPSPGATAHPQPAENNQPLCRRKPWPQTRRCWFYHDKPSFSTWWPWINEILHFASLNSQLF